MTTMTTECPACQAAVEIDLEDIGEGDCVVCDQCDEALTVVTVKPLVVEIDTEDADDDFEDDDDLEGDELDSDEDSDEDLDDDFEDEDEDE